MGNTINDGTFGKTDTLDCADGKSLNIGGSTNTLTVKGRCNSVIIGGDGNKITFDKVDTDLIVAGLNNTVTYREGDPQVQDLGTGNTITKGSSRQMITRLLPKLALATVAAIAMYASTLGLPVLGSCLGKAGVADAAPSPTCGGDLRECLRLSAKPVSTGPDT